MTAQTPQAGIIPEPNQHALFLVTANFHKSGAIFFQNSVPLFEK